MQKFASPLASRRAAVFVETTVYIGIAASYLRGA